MKISALRRFLDNAERTGHTEIKFFDNNDSCISSGDETSFTVNLEDVVVLDISYEDSVDNWGDSKIFFDIVE